MLPFGQSNEGRDPITSWEMLFKIVLVHNVRESYCQPSNFVSK